MGTFDDLRFSLFRAIELFEDMWSDDMKPQALRSRDEFKERQVADRLHNEMCRMLDEKYFDDCEPIDADAYDSTATTADTAATSEHDQSPAYYEDIDEHQTYEIGSDTDSRQTFGRDGSEVDVSTTYIGTVDRRGRHRQDQQQQDHHHHHHHHHQGAHDVHDAHHHEHQDHHDHHDPNHHHNRSEHDHEQNSDDNSAKDMRPSDRFGASKSPISSTSSLQDTPALMGSSSTIESGTSGTTEPTTTAPTDNTASISKTTTTPASPTTPTTTTSTASLSKSPDHQQAFKQQMVATIRNKAPTADEVLAGGALKVAKSREKIDDDKGTIIKHSQSKPIKGILKHSPTRRKSEGSLRPNEDHEGEREKDKEKEKDEDDDEGAPDRRQTAALRRDRLQREKNKSTARRLIDKVVSFVKPIRRTSLTARNKTSTGKGSRERRQEENTYSDDVTDEDDEDDENEDEDEDEDDDDEDEDEDEGSRAENIGRRHNQYGLDRRRKPPSR